MSNITFDTDLEAQTSEKVQEPVTAFASNSQDTATSPITEQETRQDDHGASDFCNRQEMGASDEKAKSSLPENFPDIYSNFLKERRNRRGSNGTDESAWSDAQRLMLDSELRMEKGETLNASQGLPLRWMNGPRSREEKHRALAALGVEETGDNLDISRDEQHRRIFRMAEEFCETNQACSIRFERLAMVCLLHAQHQLVQMDERLSQNDGVLETAKQLEELKSMLRDYHDCVWLVKDFTELGRPSIGTTRRYGANLAKRLLEPQYWFCSDALNLFDLSSKPTSDRSDGLRRFMQNLLPERFLDTDGVEGRQVYQTGKKKEKLSAGTRKIFRALEKQPMHISPFVDKASRVAIAIFGAVFLLLPMFIMTVIRTSNDENVIITVVFTMVFAIAMALSTQATNQEVLAASAAYTAVLVVFVGASMGSRNP